MFTGAASDQPAAENVASICVRDPTNTSVAGSIALPVTVSLRSGSRASVAGPTVVPATRTIGNGRSGGACRGSLIACANVRETKPTASAIAVPCHTGPDPSASRAGQSVSPTHVDTADATASPRTVPATTSLVQWKPRTTLLYATPIVTVAARSAIATCARSVCVARIPRYAR
jgi:hypothetical protein